MERFAINVPATLTIEVEAKNARAALDIAKRWQAMANACDYFSEVDAEIPEERWTRHLGSALLHVDTRPVTLASAQDSGGEG